MDHAGVELLQQQQTNGHGSEQAINGNCCMHIHKRNKGWGSPYIYSKQISLLQKVGVAHVVNVAVEAITVLPDGAFLILSLT